MTKTDDGVKKMQTPSGAGRQESRMESKTDNWARPFVRSLLSEADGTGSSARFCMVLVVLFTLGWVTGLVVHERRLPDLGAVGEYTVLVCGALYGINRGATLWDRKVTQDDGK
jgi:hypothetical protein